MIEKHLLQSLLFNNNDELHPNLTSGQSTGLPINENKIKNNLKQLGLKTFKQLPENFDWRTQFKKTGATMCPIIDQGKCGCCWACAATSAFNDRFMIAVQKDGLQLDTLATTVCTEGAKCAGGLPENCQAYFSTKGANRETKSTGWDAYCNTSNKCCDNCTCDNCTQDQIAQLMKNQPDITCDSIIDTIGGYKTLKTVDNKAVANIIFKSSSVVNIPGTLNAIKLEILTSGPIVGKFAVFSDFIASENKMVVNNDKQNLLKWESTNHVYIHGSYNTEINQTFKNIAHLHKNTKNIDQNKLKILSNGKMPYHHKKHGLIGVDTQSPVGYHAVSIIGWGKDKTFGEYWIVKNSWGSNWNEGGYFKYAMNVNGIINNNCGLDIPFYQVDESGYSTLFGGTINYYPDTKSITQKNDWKGKKIQLPSFSLNQPQFNTSTTNIVSLILVSLLIVLIIVGMIYIINTLYKNK